MITRADKEKSIVEIGEKLGKSKAAFVVNFKGMTVEQVTNLRKKLFSSDCEMKVVRNTLAKRAIDKFINSDSTFKNAFTGTNAFVFSYGEISASAKLLTNFSKDVEVFQLKSGLMDGRVMDESKMQFLATLPSKEVLRAQFLGVLNAPGTKLVRTMNEVGSSFARVLNAHATKGN